MSAPRYQAALAEVRLILSARSQADPILEAADVWDALTCWPIPSLRTIRRFMEQIRSESQVGHAGHGHAGHTESGPTVV